MAEERRIREEEERLLKEREGERNAELANPALYGVTCGWVEALAIITGWRRSLEGDWDLSKIPECGKIILHVVRNCGNLFMNSLIRISEDCLSVGLN